MGVDKTERGKRRKRDKCHELSGLELWDEHVAGEAHVLAHYGLNVSKRKKLLMGRSRDLYTQNDVALDSFRSRLTNHSACAR